MAAATSQGRRADPVKQFSVFTANRLGRLHEIVRSLSSQEVHVLALTVLDTTDSAILRLVVDDPDQARSILQENGFAFTESDLLVVQLTATTELPALMNGLLEAEINVNYLYSFIPNPGGKPLIALSMEDNDIAEQALRRRQFNVLKQSDISR
jgi:hypothetical protein